MPESLNFRKDQYCDRDRLGFDKHINTLTSMIRAKDFETPFCIGIYGKWGSGKTSFMHLLHNELKEIKNKPYPVPVWFNPWRYEEEEHLIVPFLRTIERDLRIYAARIEERKGRLSKVKGLVKDGVIATAEASWDVVTALASAVEVNFIGCKTSEKLLVQNTRQQIQKKFFFTF